MAGVPRGGRSYTLQTPRSWLARAVLAVVLAGFAVLAFFFLVVFLVIGAALVTGLLIRWWWRARTIKREQAAASIEGEYVVVESGNAPLSSQAQQSRELPHQDNSR